MDTEGNLLRAVVHAADLADRASALWVIGQTAHHWPTLQKLWADQGYTGELGQRVRERYGIDLEIVYKPPEQVGCEVLPRRWVVERSHAWSGRYRRLSKEYEVWPEYTETVIYLASCHRLLQRLYPNPHTEPAYARRHR